MNFPNFPLYETLCETMKKDFAELDDEEKKNIIEKIKVMEDEKQEIVYALIKAYYMEEQQSFLSSKDLPYEGKVLKNRLKFDLDCIPSKLQYILKLFCSIN